MTSSKMTTLYSIRHAQSDSSVRDDNLRPLTEAGQRQAEALAETLQKVKFDALYASTYPRTSETLKPLAAKQNLKIVPIFNLRERVLGQVAPEQADRHRKAQWADENYKAEQGESILEVEQRNLKSLRSILRMHPGQTIGVGTHGFALSVILRALGDFDYQDHLALIEKSPCVYRLDFQGEKIAQIEEIQLN